MPHSTVSDLGLYCLSHQDVSGKYYHFFIAKVTVSRELFHAFLSSADVFILLYFIFFYFFLKNIFFQEEIRIKKNQTASIQSRPDIICPA